MKFYAITYDLRQPGRKYDELYEEIKEQAGDSNWQHPMESFWVIAVSEYSPKDKETMYKALRQYIDDNDSLFITRIDNTEHQGWMPKNFWNWFKEKIVQQ